MTETTKHGSEGVDKQLPRRFVISGSLSMSISLTFFALAGCAIGTDFQVPQTPEITSYTHSPLPIRTVSSDSLQGDAQVFIKDRDIPSQWWQLFESEPLNNLITRALLSNPELQAAEATIKQAQENLYASKGSLYPALDLQTGVSRRQFSGASFGQPDLPSSLFTLYNASVDISYDLDVFGRTGREIEALMAQVETEEFRREATYLTLTANIVTFAVQEASLREQISQTQFIADAELERIELMRQDLQLGAIAQIEVSAQEVNLAQILVSLPALKKQLASTRTQLAILVGQMPHEDLPETFTLSALRLPQELPLSVPSTLVQQRPDVRIAEALLHVASAEANVALANMFPQFTLTGSYGGLATEFADVISPDSLIWNIGAGLAQPIFRGGQLRHRKNAAQAGFDRAAAQYRGAVLQAFKNVADSLQALQFDAETLAAQAVAEQAAANNLAMAEQQLEVGAINYTALLDAQRSFHQARIGLVQSQAARIVDTAALFQSLGGGWWNRQE